MIEINLLPWRNEKRAREKRNSKLYLIVSVLLGLMILIVTHIGFTCYLAKLNQRSGLLEATLEKMQSSINKLTDLKKQNEILSWQLNHAQSLENTSRESRAKIHELTAMMFLNISITDMVLAKNALTIKGETNSIEKLQSLVRQFQQSNYFSNLQLKEINQLPRARNFYFTLIANGGRSEHDIS